MSKRRKVAGGIAGILLIFAVLTLAAPFLIREYVKKKYPEVQVGRVTLGWPATFHDVMINRAGLLADLREVRVTPRRTDPIRISGGTVVIIRGQSSAGEASGRTILAEKLDVTVLDGDDRIELKDVTVDDKYRFKSGRASMRDYQVELLEGIVSKDRKTLEAETVEVEVELPFELPRFPKKGRLRASRIQADLSKKEVEIGEVVFASAKAEHIKVIYKPNVLVSTVQRITTDHPWISVGPTTFHDVSFHVPLPVSSIDLGIGRASFHVDPKTYHVLGDNSCSALVEALPYPRPEAFQVPPEAFSGHIQFDVQAKPKPKFQLRYACKLACDVDLIQSLRAKSFTYMAYDSKGNLFARTIGRQMAGWTSIGVIPGHVTKAFITLEDPGFPSHRGIIPQALLNSFTDNLRLGEFFRGGSTITQQLAKNLWLRRHKTLNRKVYEAFLAMALESCLSKDEILELYLNVVEFGPDLYGIGSASQHYFKKDVADLSVEEAFYLARILPNPRKVLPPDQGGLESAKKLMKNLVDSGFLNETYLQVTPDTTGWDIAE